MTPAEVVSLINRFVIEVQQNAHYEQIDELIHKDFIDHTAAPGLSFTRDGIAQVMKIYHDALEDVQIELVHCVSDGETVATMKIVRGRLVCDLGEKKATKGPVEVRIMNFMKLAEGKIREHWANVGLMRDVL